MPKQPETAPLPCAVQTMFREARLKAGLSQQDMAEALLISRNFVSQIEIGSKRPSQRIIAMLKVFAETRGISLDGTVPTAELFARQRLLHAKDSQITLTHASPNSANLAREHLERVLRAAGGDSARQGWILEQLRVHVNTPGHWRTTA